MPILLNQSIAYSLSKNEFFTLGGASFDLNVMMSFAESSLSDCKKIPNTYIGIELCELPSDLMLQQESKIYLGQKEIPKQGEIVLNNPNELLVVSYVNFFTKKIINFSVKKYDLSEFKLIKNNLAEQKYYFSYKDKQGQKKIFNNSEQTGDFVLQDNILTYQQSYTLVKVDDNLQKNEVPTSNLKNHTNQSERKISDLIKIPEIIKLSSDYCATVSFRQFQTESNSFESLLNTSAGYGVYGKQFFKIFDKKFSFIGEFNHFQLEKEVDTVLFNSEDYYSYFLGLQKDFELDYGFSFNTSGIVFNRHYLSVEENNTATLVSTPQLGLSLGAGYSKNILNNLLIELPISLLLHNSLDASSGKMALGFSIAPQIKYFLASYPITAGVKYFIDEQNFSDTKSQMQSFYYVVGLTFPFKD